jgi:hypothetical protein
MAAKLRIEHRELEVLADRRSENEKAPSPGLFQ